MQPKITARTSGVTKDMLQLVWQDVDCMWAVWRTADGAHVQVFRNWKLCHLCVKITPSIYEWNTADFIPKLQVTQLPVCFLVERVWRAVRRNAEYNNGSTFLPLYLDYGPLGLWRRVFWWWRLVFLRNLLPRLSGWKSEAYLWIFQRFIKNIVYCILGTVF